MVARLRAAGCVFAEQEAEVLLSAAGSESELSELLARRESGIPLEQVVGWAEFCGLRVGVVPGVFVPRRRSALLVRLAAELAPPDPVVLDLCCGSGAIGLAVAARLPGLELHAADIDPVAVGCAGQNMLGVGAVHRGDLYAALPQHLRGRCDLIVVNAPYVPSDAIGLMPAEARDHEPRVALDGGPDGLDVHRRVAAGAPEWLAPAGVLLVETSAAQASGTAAALDRVGLGSTVRRSRRMGATVVTGRRR